MTVPTNWPNPERPGVPLFPERDGWHWIRDKESGGLYPCKWFVSVENIYGGFWDTPGKRVHPYTMARTDDYCGPCLTPTQLTELLAGERERLDWLERQFVSCTVYMNGERMFTPGPKVRNLKGRDFREAIDAARENAND